MSLFWVWKENLFQWCSEECSMSFLWFSQQFFKRCSHSETILCGLERRLWKLVGASRGSQQNLYVYIVIGRTFDTIESGVDEAPVHPGATVENSGRCRLFSRLFIFLPRKNGTPRAISNDGEAYEEEWERREDKTDRAIQSHKPRVTGREGTSDPTLNMEESVWDRDKTLSLTKPEATDSVFPSYFFSLFHSVSCKLSSRNAMRRALSRYRVFESSQRFQRSDIFTSLENFPAGNENDRVRKFQHFFSLNTLETFFIGFLRSRSYICIARNFLFLFFSQFFVHSLLRLVAIFQ